MFKSIRKKTKKDEQIYQLSTLAAGELSLQEVLDRLTEAAVKITNTKACSIRLLDRETENLKMRSTYGLSEKYRDKGVVSKNDPVIKAAFLGEAAVVDDMKSDPRVRYAREAAKEGIVSQLTVAMEFRKKAIGVLRLYSPKLKRFSQDDISIARAVSSQCAVAVTNARLYSKAVEGMRMAQQMRIAGVIQRRMIPKRAPHIDGLDVSAVYVPCFQVGGDLYQFEKIHDKRISIDIADVIGKGFPAALMMSWFRGTVAAHIANARSRIDPKEEKTVNKKILLDVISKINEITCDEVKDGEFITLFHAGIDMANRTITYCNCGHEPAVLIRNGRTVDLDAGGLVLGVDRNAEYESETVELKQGDCLLFYTDGLIDAANFEGQFWGRERMLDAAKKYISGSAKSIVKNILAYRRRFVGLAKQIDDTSIIAVKVNE